MAASERALRVTATVEVPRVPNFLRMADGQTLPLSAVTDEDLRAIGAIWTDALLDRASEQRAILEREGAS